MILFRFRELADPHGVEYVNSQENLDDLAFRLQREGCEGSLHIQVQVRPSQRQLLRMDQFLDSICPGVDALSLVIIPIDRTLARRLADNVMQTLRCLRLTTVLSEAVPDLCRGLSTTSSLKEILVIARDNWSVECAESIWTALRQNRSVRVMGVCGLPAADAALEDLLLEDESPLVDLRLIASGISSFASIAGAIRRKNRLRRLTLMENRYVSPEGFDELWATPSLQEVVYNEDFLHDVSRIFRGLRHNTTLKSLDLSLFRLPEGCIEVLQDVLQYNTSLQSISFHRGSEQQTSWLCHHVALNKAGLGWIRSATDPSLLPHVLSRSSDNVSILYALLQEKPQLWLPTAIASEEELSTRSTER